MSTVMTRPGTRTVPVRPVGRLDPMSFDQLVIRGAREHNLRNVSSSCPATG